MKLLRFEAKDLPFSAFRHLESCISTLNDVGEVMQGHGHLVLADVLDLSLQFFHFGLEGILLLLHSVSTPQQQLSNGLKKKLKRNHLVSALLTCLRNVSLG